MMEDVVGGGKGDPEQLELGRHPVSLLVPAKTERHGTVFWESSRISFIATVTLEMPPPPGSEPSGLGPATLVGGLAYHIAA